MKMRENEKVICREAYGEKYSIPVVSVAAAALDFILCAIFCYLFEYTIADQVLYVAEYMHTFPDYLFVSPSRSLSVSLFHI